MVIYFIAYLSLPAISDIFLQVGNDDFAVSQFFMFFWYLLLLRGNLFCAQKWIVELDEEAQRAKRIIQPL
jgi:hypothetical protein